MNIYLKKKYFMLPFFGAVCIILLSLYMLWELRSTGESFFFSVGLDYFFAIVLGILGIYIGYGTLGSIFWKGPIMKIDSGILYYKNLCFEIGDIRRAHLFPLGNFFILRIEFKMTKLQKEGLSLFQLMKYNFNHKTSGYHLALPLTGISQKDIDGIMKIIS
ncbi:hypothetical protein LAT59_02405 [Candidatus Gracilibacteria bacterium]|nr:hypothetical protein [Candidatus Gracilibacteria bacterium]